MNNYQTRFTPPTLQLGLMAWAIFAGNGMSHHDLTGPELPRDPYFSVEPKAYFKQATSSTYNTASSLLGENSMLTHTIFDDALMDFFADLSKRQMLLPDEFATVLSENLWDLYSE